MAPPSLTKSDSDINGVDFTGKPLFRLEDSNLLANGHVVLTDVPTNVTLTPSPYLTDKDGVPLDVSAGSFVGFNLDGEPKSHHVASIGKLKNIRFMSIFRFKVWWTTHWVGSNGRDIENETQIIILDNSGSDSGSGSGSGRPYVLLLPLLEGPFRSSFTSGENDDVAVCVESGSTQVTGSEFRQIVYVHAGDDPFKLVKDAMKVIRIHMNTFKLLDEKSPPGIVDKFGWCTWDAFYLTVNPEGVHKGVKCLVDGGCPPGLVLIDDGWQSIGHDADGIDVEGMNITVAGEQMPCRLLKFEENHKFKDYVSPKDQNDVGMKAFVRDLKDEFSTVDYIYVWHALCGYWGGLRPDAPTLPPSTIIRPELSPGLKLTMEDLAVDKIIETGIGLASPDLAKEFYEGLHSHLQNSGIDGVKVDVIHILEMLCEKYGGRVDMAKAYFKGLTSSVNKHFNGNGVIASMEHCNDFMFLGTEAIALGRVGDDFWCTDPSGDPNGTFWLQGCHMVHCAYNSLWMGNFIQPDWDMFQTTHPCAEFHAASRAISGGPIYVSDCVGKHDFDLLKRLVLPNGSILRCEYYALPTRDRLFEDPLHDGKTMLKIWNLNKFTGIIGAFNCQGGGWCRETRRNQCFSECVNTVTATTRPSDVEWNSGKNPISIANVEEFALFLSQSKKLVLSGPNDELELTLEPFKFELITVSPVVTIEGKSVRFAPIGLVNMLNTSGAISSLVYHDESVEVDVFGAGEFRVYASRKPVSCLIDGGVVEFAYEDSMVMVQVPWAGPEGLSSIEYLF
ncbi:PREDICTED: probable galactinol--sucrose galactosyltransferase 5 [Camelina sativa]|uniref:galactinol--sucrose galactosyltransferase n=1 Tax=Camelina sativa TaxID=90675 RepID=A0ABM0V4L6_CAMSA|nr:PREDICTED: probable galactinol--sucrose galactosyltransferase 5 [Camelina sativa]